jgi:hypothetical protein
MSAEAVAISGEGAGSGLGWRAAHALMVSAVAVSAAILIASFIPSS